MDGLAQVGRPKSMALNVKVSRFLAVSLKLPPLHITSPRPVVRFLSRGPDETGREDRWGILSQSQVPDPTGASVLSGLLRHTSWLSPLLLHRRSCVVSMCLASDLLCWDADWFPQGVCDLAQRSDGQLLRGVRTQVCKTPQLPELWLK